MGRFELLVLILAALVFALGFVMGHEARSIVVVCEVAAYCPPPVSRPLKMGDM